jgi:hypothetical protein
LSEEGEATFFVLKSKWFHAAKTNFAGSELKHAAANKQTRL